MTETNDWLEGAYLLVKDVFDNDIITIVEECGIVDSFGKQKLQLVVDHNGKRKTLNVNRIQAKQLLPIRAGGKYAVTKKAINGGTALNFERM